MATTNPQSGVSTVFNEAFAMTTVDVSIGSVATPASGANTLNNAAGQHVLTVDSVPASRIIAGSGQVYGVHNAINKRSESKPSGYNAAGVPTYGDGKITYNDVWKEDHDLTQGGNIAYFNQSAPTGTKFPDLTS